MTDSGDEDCVTATVPTCVNHRDVETRVSCSSCGDPICTRCMRQSPVGQKCPRCARLPRSARARGKPIHYVRAVGAGGAVALVGGLVLRQLLGSIGFGAILLPGLLGFGVGRAVGWGASRQSQQPFPAIAIGLAVVGAVLAGGGIGIIGRPFAMLGVAAAGYFAMRGLQS